MKTDTKSLYEVTNSNIIQQLKQGVQPWHYPWKAQYDDSILPYSAMTNKHYSGINTILLWSQMLEHKFATNGWITFKQAVKANGKVKKGEHGVRCFYYNLHKQEVVEDGKTVVKQTPEVKSFFAFNVEQVEGKLDLPQHSTACPSVNVEELIKATGAELTEGKEAYHSKTKGYIVLPPKSSFTKEADYYATILHELIHWTSHEDRLDWGMTSAELGKNGDYYAFEELVAVMGGAFLCAELGVLGKHFKSHDMYIERWIKLCEKDENIIFKAAKLATRAHKYIMSKVKANNA